jgi:hypothetical protein
MLLLNCDCHEQLLTSRKVVRLPCRLQMQELTLELKRLT